MASTVPRRPFTQVNPERNPPQSLRPCRRAADADVRPVDAEITPSLLQGFSAEVVRHG